MANIERIKTNKRMSQIVVSNDTIYLSGQVGDKKTTDFKMQTSGALEKIGNLLNESGTDKSKLLSATIYLSDISYFEELNEIWDNWLSENCSPARATVEAKLALPEFLVEICIIASK